MFQRYCFHLGFWLSPMGRFGAITRKPTMLFGTAPNSQWSCCKKRQRWWRVFCSLRPWIKALEGPLSEKDKDRLAKFKDKAGMVIKRIDKHGRQTVWLASSSFFRVWVTYNNRLTYTVLTIYFNPSACTIYKHVYYIIIYYKLHVCEGKLFLAILQMTIAGKVARDFANPLHIQRNLGGHCWNTMQWLGQLDSWRKNPWMIPYDLCRMYVLCYCALLKTYSCRWDCGMQPEWSYTSKHPIDLLCSPLVSAHAWTKAQMASSTPAPQPQMPDETRKYPLKAGQWKELSFHVVMHCFVSFTYWSILLLSLSVSLLLVAPLLLCRFQLLVCDNHMDILHHSRGFLHYCCGSSLTYVI